METFLKQDFFERDSHVVAKELLGKNLVRVFDDGKKAVGKIVEVEVYQGFEDKASHAARKKTERNQVMYLSGGHYYIYLIYGMYYCLNIVTEKGDYPAAILIRALEPISDERIDFDKLSEKEKLFLANGPGKLCRWLKVDKNLNGSNVENEKLYLSFERNEMESRSEEFSTSSNNIISAKRIGVDYAGESAHLEWRYYLKDNKYISRK